MGRGQAKLEHLRCSGHSSLFAGLDAWRRCSAATMSTIRTGTLRLNDPLPLHPPLSPDNRLVQLAGEFASRAEVSLHGAQVLSWTSGGRERLYMSPRARIVPGKAIRGGIPVVFPQFAQRGNGFRHGFARLREWRLADCAMPDPARTKLVLTDSEHSLESWPHRFHAELQVALVESQLSASLQVTNTDTREFVFTAALHTYLRVEDIDQACLMGLERRPYLDCAGKIVSRSQDEHPLRFAGEIDRIYPNASGVCVLQDGIGSVRIESHGFADTVVWNPGPQLAAATDDLGPGQHVHFVCVEAAAVESPIRLGPGESWKGSQTLVALDRDPAIPGDPNAAPASSLR